MSENQDFHNKGGMIAFIGSLAFVTLFIIYLVTLDRGVDLGEKIEIPAPAGSPVYDLASEKEPWVSNPDIIKAGAKIFKQTCAVCHGEKGDLVGSQVAARNFVEGKWTQGDGLVAHYKVLQHGIKGTQMLSFSTQLKPYERWAVLHFIETITNNKSKDTPQEVAAFAKTAE